MGWNPFEWVGDIVEDAVDFVEDAFEDVVDFADDILHVVDDVLIHPITSEIKGWLLPDIPSVPSIENIEDDLSINTNVRSGNNEFIPIVYGERFIAGTRAFIGTSGDNNEFLHIVTIVSEGEIEEFSQIFLDEVDYTDSRYSGLVTVTTYNGTDSQTADANLIAAIPSIDSNFRLRGLAYSYIKLTFNPDVFSSLPKILHKIKGRKLFDPRTSTTYYSDNPALVLWDYLTNARYGRGLDTSSLNQQSFEDIADHCEVQLNPLIFVFIDQYQCDAIVDTRNRIIDNINKILATFRGFMPYIQGQYKLIADKDETPVFEFNVDNIIGGWHFSVGGKRERSNRVKVNFIHINAALFQVAHSIVVESSDFLANDGGFELEKVLDLPFVTMSVCARNLAQINLQQSRQQLRCSFTSTIEALQVEPGDVVSVTHATPGWNSKKFRVTKMTLRDDGNVTVQLNEHDASVYSLDSPIIESTDVDTDLPNSAVVTAPTLITLESGTDQLIIGASGSIVSAVEMTWVASPDIYVTHYETEYKKTANSIYLPGPDAIGRSATKALIAPVDDGTTYDFRVRAVNTRGFASSWLIDSHLVIGKTEPPPDVDNFLVTRQSDGTREFTWSYPTPPADLSGFTIKTKLGTGHAWGDLQDITGAEKLPSGIRAWESNQLAAGTYTFGIKAVDTTGNESVNAKIIETALGDPRIAGQLLTQTSEPTWSGTKTDCTVTDGVLEAVGTKDWSDFTTDGITWATWNAWNRVPDGSIAYEIVEIDIGAIVTFTPLVTGIAEGTLSFDYDYSTDGISYAGWATYTGEILTARYLKIKSFVTGSFPKLSSLKIILSAEITDEEIEDLDTSTLTGSYRIGTGDIRLPITETYAIIRTVQVTLQNIGAGWSWELIDKDTSVGPRIKIYNGSDTLADATIDAYVRGI